MTARWAGEEELARALHEAGREAVGKGQVLNSIRGQKFFEWKDLTEKAREGRRTQARWLLDRFMVLVDQTPSSGDAAA